MSAKHTPGPWAISDRSTGAIRTADQKMRICYMEVADCESEFKSNAALIALAPELLQALIAIREDGQEYDPGCDCQSCLRKSEELDELINRAKEN